MCDCALIIKRIKACVSKELLKEIDFSDLGKKDYKYLIRNYKFFDFEKVIIKGKKKKPLTDQTLRNNNFSVQNKIQ